MATLKFWGVRGSIPTPGPATVRYGGNTSCSELQHDGKLFILDAGSGLRVLGNELLKTGKPISASILISHMHWDHIQGIPFFTPAFIPDNHFIFYGSAEAGKDLPTIIADQMDPTYFPIEMKEMGSTMKFEPLYEGKYDIDGVPVETIYVNHPGNALGYKFHLDDKKLVYISDNEPFPTAEKNDDPEQVLLGEDSNKKLIDFIKDVDVLVHDAQYTQEEYEKKVTWGHSPIEYTVDIAVKARVKKLILFHHDPLHDDDTIDKMLAHAREYAKESGANHIEILAASEGLAFVI